MANDTSDEGVTEYNKRMKDAHFLPKNEKDNDVSTTLPFLPTEAPNENQGSHHTNATVYKRHEGYKKYFGLILTVIAALQFSLSAMIIKILNLDPFNLGVWRFPIMMLIPTPFIIHAAVFKKENVFKPIFPLNRTSAFLLAQAIVGSNSLILLFYGFQRINLADALVITASAPVFVTLIAYVFLGEKLGVFPIFMAILTLLGVAIICRPPVLTGAASFDETAMIGSALTFGSMICLATGYVIIRHLRTVNHAVVNLAFGICGFLESLLISIYIGALEVPQDLNQALLIIASACLAFSAQTCITLALKYEQAGPVSLVRTSELLFAFLWQLLFLGVRPDAYSLIGAVIVVCCVALTAIRKMVQSLPEEDKYRQKFNIFLR